MNVSFLVGLAFSIAASANFPAIIMILFWKRTTAKGIVASVSSGYGRFLAIILVSPSMFLRYGMDPASSPSDSITQPSFRFLSVLPPCGSLVDHGEKESLKPIIDKNGRSKIDACVPFILVPSDPPILGRTSSQLKTSLCNMLLFIYSYVSLWKTHIRKKPDLGSRHYESPQPLKCCFPNR